MNFPLADLEGIADLLGDTLEPAIAGAAQRGLPHRELVEALGVVERLGRIVDAARLTLAGEVGLRADSESGEDSITGRFGCGSAQELVERAALVASATARSRLRDAKAITTRVTLTGQTRPAPLEHARIALASGRFGADALATIVDALRPLLGRCTADELEAAEVELVGAAVGGAEAPACGIHELKVMATTWALFLDPDGTLPDEEYAERMRGIRVSRRSRRGLRRISGDVTDDVAAQFDRLMDAHLNPRVHGRGPRFVDAADAEHSDERVPDPRTVDQKRHDAFASILSAAAGAAETPTLGGAAPTLIVTTTDGDLAAADGVAFLESATGPVPVPAALARHVGCHGTVHRLTLAPNCAITSLRIEDRVFNRWQRKAIGARDGGCIIPGCTVPAAWCEVHHVVDWAKGGPTSVDNGVLLCWHHHRGIETSGWEVRMVDGMPQVRPPGWLDPQRRWRGPNKLLLNELRRARSA
ncbi:HNH endonuclease signature motif containing protein [Microbacterium timonense]|uniref:HNH endonuclease signature motif containing protein n=1 Tax=Microbacterium timonense TaxID=2086576 RepID=UPI000D0FE91D|nr:HNH endonuclease signature motif containing protein [Microbacterium timonense]